MDVDPTYLRFWTVAQNTGNPKTAIKRISNQTLINMVSTNYATFAGATIRADALYFEVLDISLAELDTKKNVKVSWISEGITKDVSIPDQSIQAPGRVLTGYRNNLTYSYPKLEP